MADQERHGGPEEREQAGQCDHGAVAELVAAVAPKPVNVVVHQYDAGIRAFAERGVRRCSVGGSLARKTWEAFDAASQTLKRCDVGDRY